MTQMSRFRFRSYLAFPLRMLRQPGQARSILRWLASLAPAPLRPNIPWLVFAAVARLEAIDLRGARVFEYGSGASTRYWLRRGATLTSIEHDPAWYAQVQRTLPRGAPVDYRLVQPEPAPPGDPSDPNAYASAALPGWSFRRYVEQIAAVRDDSLDIVLIDGRARPACLAQALPKVRPGGLVILDNSDRPYYTAQLGAAPAGFTPTIYTGAVPGVPVFAQTTFFLRAEG
jgi:hypothetical protein